jgi:hypothetical protein
MVNTRLQIYGDEYKKVLKKNREMIAYYRNLGIGLTSDGVMEKRCDMLYKIHTATVKYLKMYHGNNYDTFEREYKKALIDYNNMAEKNMDQRKLKAAAEREKILKKRLYKCLDEIMYE